MYAYDVFGGPSAAGIAASASLGPVVLVVSVEAVGPSVVLGISTSDGDDIHRWMGNQHAP